MEATRSCRTLSCAGLALALVAAMPAPAEAATFQRAGLEELVATNGTVVVGEVVDVHSYWNAGATFILSDVRLAVEDTLKGRSDDGFLTVTVLGGTVGETTVLIVGGPQLVPGQRYVLFAEVDSLPGAPGVRTLRDHAQGVFEVVEDGDDVRALSQARRLPLAPDVFGETRPAGGVEGFSLPELIQTVRTLDGTDRGARREVNR